MRKVTIFLIMLLLAGCTSTRPEEGTFTYERDGRSYNPHIIYEVLNATQWMDSNLPPDAVIVAWWDYGHMIRGRGNRDVVASI